MRVRLTASTALLVALALAGAGLIVYAIQSERMEAETLAEVDQELAEFAALRDQRGRNPDTARPFDDVRQMIRTFLLRNVPQSDEVLVGWWDDRPQVRSPADDVTQDHEFREAVRGLLDTGGNVEVSTAGHGELLVTVQPVRTASGANSGALVVVTYLDRARDELIDTMRTYTIASLLALLAITALAAWQSGRLLAPLRTLQETAEEISETDLARRLPETGNDDITALTRTFNGMLARLESAFVGQREFLDDAGHELKTPLTVLRGHLELLDHENPEEVAETRALLLDETDRMARLVGDLILLAKTGRPDFLAPKPVDVERLTHSLLAKARALGDRAWQLDEAAQVTADLDEQRVTQAVLQFADNAVKHTDPGDTVALGSSCDDHLLRLWVRDTGPGVPEADREHVFERFARSEVRPGDEGFGLGLSIVRAIAEVHGGTVTVEDADPPGARFVISLPYVREDAWPAS